MIERLSVPLRWWVQTVMFIATIWLALIVAIAAPVAWAVTAVLLILMALAFISLGSAAIEVTDTTLRVGRSQIDLQYVGEAQALDEDNLRRVAGVDADARAFLMLRPYLHRGVKITIDDPRDPTPYWLVASRRPEAVVAALTRSRGRSSS